MKPVAISREPTRVFAKFDGAHRYVRVHATSIDFKMTQLGLRISDLQCIADRRVMKFMDLAITKRRRVIFGLQMGERRWVFAANVCGDQVRGTLGGIIEASYSIWCESAPIELMDR